MKIIIIGGNVFKEDGPVLNFIKVCKKYNLKTFLITDKNHLNYPTKQNISFKKELRKLNIQYKCFSKFDNKTLDFITFISKNQKSIVISLNSIWIFNQKYILKLKKIYNYHNADLPLFRGAACHSWRIMMNHFITTLNIHLVSKKIDQGDIILQKKIKISKYIQNLSDFYNYIEPFEIALFDKFIQNINKKKFKLIKQNNSKSFYWPALNTKKNGFIDWSWTSKEIVLFSNAFDRPFIGVSTFLKKKKIYLTNAKLVDQKKKFHPYQIGLIYRKVKSRIFVATKKGGVSFIYSNKKNIKLKLLGSRLYTDPKSIILSRGIE